MESPNLPFQGRSLPPRDYAYLSRSSPPRAPFSRALSSSALSAAESGPPLPLKRPPEYLCHGEAPTWALTERRGRFSCVRSGSGILEVFASRVTAEGRSRDFLNRLVGRNAPRGPCLSSACEPQGPSSCFFGRTRSWTVVCVRPLALCNFDRAASLQF